MGLCFTKIFSQFSKTRFKLIKRTLIFYSLKELITKNLEVKDKFNYELQKTVDSYQDSFLSNPISSAIELASILSISAGFIL